MTTVLHVITGPRGGAFLSTTDVARGTQEAYDHAAVSHIGSAEAQEAARAAFPGPILFTRLHLWHRRLRHPLPRRLGAVAGQDVITMLGMWPIRRIMRVARDSGADLIHSNTFVSSDGAVAAAALGLPHVWHVRELIGPGRPYRFPAEGRRLAGFVRQYGGRVVANSAATAEAFKSVAPGVEPDVVYNGVDLEPFRGVTEPDGGGGLVVGMVGSVAATWKRHDRFVECAGHLRDVKDATFRIYGGLPEPGTSAGAWYRRLLDEAGELGLTDRLQFAGHVPDPARIMREIDVLVQPTSDESFGRVVVEAMAAGRPVVAVNDGPMSELVTDDAAGVLVEPSAAALAQGVRRYLESPERRQRARKAGPHVAVGFSRERLSVRMAEIYEQALLHHPRQRRLAEPWAAARLVSLGGGSKDTWAAVAPKGWRLGGRDL